MKRFFVLLLILMLLITAALTAYANPSQSQEGNEADAAAALAASRKAEVASGIIGGYVEQVNELALAVESNGRIHVLWTGVLNPDFVIGGVENKFAFYSTSTDGLNWTPYRILSYWMAYEPQVVVDDVHQVVHLMYRSNYDGIVHHTVSNGVVSDPVTLDSGGVVSPQMAVDPTTGYLYAVWMQGHYVRISADSYSWRYYSWYAYWDGTDWSSRQRLINDDDTGYTTLAVAPGEGVMLAWFQQWAASAGGSIDPGDPIVVRTAYGAGPDRYPLRQAVSDYYTVPQKDDSILLTYSGGDGKFIVVCKHLMWPGHSRIYRYTWQDGVWTVSDDEFGMLGYTSYWAVPLYVGAATDISLVNYVYSYNEHTYLRTESNGVLGAAQLLSEYLALRGYIGSGHSFFTGSDGGLHMAIVGSKNGVNGFYYVSP
ncbi:MAG: hypothetical protein JXA42_23980 [Anaerolineales bacterium]|nr:hypothetical protein [Anaerolineales bacterium]